MVASAKRPGIVLGIGRILGPLASRMLSAVASVFHLTLAALLTFMFPEWYGPNKRYRPGQHYMRGPGPKCRAKRGM
jgi:hypothetical protein